MKRVVLAASFFIGFMLNQTQLRAQDTSEKILSTKVTQFFDAMAKRDSAQMRSFFYGNPSLESIHKNKEGKSVFEAEVLDSFLTSVANIPTTLKFQERIDKTTVHQDGLIAVAWCEYTFILNGKVSHTGVDVFTFAYINSDWKIIRLADSRRK
ncbi:MAG: hypothetical protein CFE21_00570 [Bacteroidetes bacterium B1(2017)]|nr:MAG: hypothetical protein CFE21_00570 [Bacteroidetes bacterium B1(2017)]